MGESAFLKSSTNAELEREAGKAIHDEHTPIVSSKEWESARQELLVREKELTRARDRLAAERRRMPWLALRRRTSSTDRTAR